MAFFNIFKRNKNAVKLPSNLRDFSTITDVYTENESVSFANIDKIASAFAMLNYGVYSTKDHSKVNNHWLSDIVEQPNLDETHSLFWTSLVKDYFAGNIYLYKYFNEDGQIVSLFRMNPSQVTVTRDALNRKQYAYNGYTYNSDRVLHIPSRFGYDGLKGHSIFEELKECFATSRNLNRYTENTFDNNMGKRMIIDISEAYPDATDDEIVKIRDKYIDSYSGVKNAGKPIVKDGPVNFTTIDTGSSTNQAQQLQENRAYQTKLVDMIFHIPEDDSNLENWTTKFTLFAIQPIAQAIEEALNTLLPLDERGKVYFEFSYSSLLRTSLTTRIDAYQKQIMNGMLTLNDVRKKENLPEYDTRAANTPIVPANMMPATDEVFDAYMAKARKEAEDLYTKDSTGIGDDKK